MGMEQSQTDLMIGVEDGSNVGVTGRYVYKIDTKVDEWEEMDTVLVQDEADTVHEVSVKMAGVMEYKSIFGDLGSHGCSCSGNSGTVDPLDSVCSQWNGARRGLLLNDGICEGSTSNYRIDENRVCLDDISTCEGSACHLDNYYYNLSLETSTTYISTDINTCPATQDPLVADSCCGLVFDDGTKPTLKRYNSFV